MATNTTVTRVAQTDRCPRCLGTDIDYDPRETWCRNCGMVLEESPIDHGRDWRSFADDARDPERAHPGNRNHADRGLGSRMGYDGDADERLRVQDSRTRSGDRLDRNRRYATGEIHRMTTALDLPRFVGERAKHIFRAAHETDLSGADLDTVAAACLIAACRESQLGRTIDDIVGAARSDTAKIRRRFMRLQRDLGLELPPPDIRQRIRVVAGRLDASPATTERALTRFDGVANGQLAGTSPSVVTATLLYLAGDWTQAEVCDAAGCCAPSLRQCREKV